MTVGVLWGETFLVKVHNFSLFFIGQMITQSGTWMTLIAQTLCCSKLTGTGVMVWDPDCLPVRAGLNPRRLAGAIADRPTSEAAASSPRSFAMAPVLRLRLVALPDNHRRSPSSCWRAVRGIAHRLRQPGPPFLRVEMVPEDTSPTRSA